MTTAELRAAIPVLSEMIYLNCGWAGPSPAPVVQAVREALELEASRGPATVETLPTLGAHLTNARSALAALLGTDAERIALTGSTSSGICIVAAGLDWRAGDEVVISDQEHPSNALPWYQLQQQCGVVVREVAAREDTARMLEECERTITARTRLVSVSHVLWGTGQVMPLRELGELVHGRGGWLVADAAQSVGQMLATVAELGVDCYSVPGQKWLLGPSGTGGAYFSEPLTEELTPSRVGWASVRECGPGGQFELWKEAKRFETATVSAALYAGFARAGGLIEEIGVDSIRSRIQQLVGLLRERLEGRAGVRLLSPKEQSLRSGILSVQLPGEDVEQVVHRLFHEHRIVARAVGVLEAVRFSIHAYNTEEEMEEVAQAVANL